MPTPLENFVANRLPRITRSENHTNWFKNVSKSNAEIVRPDSREDLRFIIQYAEQNNKRISIFGSKWSYTNCAIDVTSDIHLDTSHLNKVLSIADLNHLGLRSISSPVRSSLSTNISAPGSQLIYVEASIKLHDLNCALDAKGLALHTLGGSSGQSLAGSINTGTHGSDVEKPPLADAVRAIHLISYSGVEWWLEPSQYLPVSKQQDWQNPKLKVIYDDDLFYSVLISFGCAGIVYAYLLETVPSHNLRSKSIQEPWANVKSQVNLLATTLTPSPVDFMEAIITHEDNCRVTRRQTTDRLSIKDYPDRQNTTVDQTDPQAQIDRLNRCWGFNILGWRIGRNEIDKQIKQTILASRPDGEFQHKSWIMHTFQPDCPSPPKEHSPTERKIRSQEYSIHARFAAQIIDELRRILIQQREDNRAIIVTINLRLTGSSRAYLAPQQHRLNAHLEIYLVEGALGNSRYETALNALIENFNSVFRGNNAKDVKIRPHWGQLHDPSIFDFNELYPMLPQWRQSIQRLKNGSIKNTFDTSFASERGLL